MSLQLPGGGSGGGTGRLSIHQLGGGSGGSGGSVGGSTRRSTQLSVHTPRRSTHRLSVTLPDIPTTFRGHSLAEQVNMVHSARKASQLSNVMLANPNDDDDIEEEGEVLQPEVCFFDSIDKF